MELTKELISVTWLFYVVGYVNIESLLIYMLMSLDIYIYIS